MQLFDYQQNAVNKAIKVYENGGQSFNLFFEMGLGKTITAIEIIKNIKHNTVLIVCPKSLIEMWAYEMSKNFNFDENEKIVDVVEWCVGKFFGTISKGQERTASKNRIMTLSGAFIYHLLYAFLTACLLYATFISMFGYYTTN